MELTVEALPGCNLPTGCFVGVRVGEVLKQGRYDPLCCYRFPALERQRNAKIDLYQHLGTCNAIVDPDTKGNNEVKFSGIEPGYSDLRLKVSTRPEASKPREERKTEVKKQAKTYLSRHQVEERLCIAVKALLAAQPDDPTEFLVEHLRESCPKAVEKKVKAAVRLPLPKILDGSSTPFSEYYKSYALQQVPPQAMQMTYKKFPRAERRDETVRSPPPQAKPAGVAPLQVPDGLRYKPTEQPTVDPPPDNNTAPADDFSAPPDFGNKKNKRQR